MQIGTPGAAYGPGLNMSRPTLGAGTPLDGGRGSSALPPRPAVLPMRGSNFNVSVHQNELANRIAALRIAKHPILAGGATTSPLMAAHAKLAAAPTVGAPPPLMSLRPVDAAWDEPGGKPQPLPAPTGLWGQGRGGAKDLLARALLARRGMTA